MPNNRRGHRFHEDVNAHFADGARHTELPAGILRQLEACNAVYRMAFPVVDDDGKLVGIFTDGDLRRRLIKGASLDEQRVKDLMTENPRSIRTGKLASSAAHLMHELKIDELPVVDADDRPVGVVDIQDILGTVG